MRVALAGRSVVCSLEQPLIETANIIKKTMKHTLILNEL